MRRLSVALVVLALSACEKEGAGTEHPPQPKDDGLLESIDESGEEIGTDIERGLEAAAEELGDGMGGGEEAPAPDDGGDEDAPDDSGEEG